MQKAYIMQSFFLLSDSRFSEGKAIIEPRVRKPKVSLRVVLSGIIYVLENGCKWEELPPGYGNYKNLWYYYNKWMAFGVLEKLRYALNEKVRVDQGQNKEPSI